MTTTTTPTTPTKGGWTKGANACWGLACYGEGVWGALNEKSFVKGDVERRQETLVLLLLLLLCAV